MPVCEMTMNDERGRGIWSFFEWKSEVEMGEGVVSYRAARFNLSGKKHLPVLYPCSQLSLFFFGKLARPLTPYLVLVLVLDMPKHE